MKLTAKKASSMTDVYAYDKIEKLIKDRCKNGFKKLYQDELDESVRNTLINLGYTVEPCVKGWLIKWGVV